MPIGDQAAAASTGEYLPWWIKKKEIFRSNAGLEDMTQ